MLTAKQVAEQLSFKEFQNICSYFDLKAASSTDFTKSLRANGFVVVRPATPIVKFDVLSIERTREALLVTCRNEKEPVCLRWDIPTNVIELKKAA
jgi:hypothetical protein